MRLLKIYCGLQIGRIYTYIYRTSARSPPERTRCGRMIDHRFVPGPYSLMPSAYERPIKPIALRMRVRCESDGNDTSNYEKKKTGNWSKRDTIYPKTGIRPNASSYSARRPIRNPLVLPTTRTHIFRFSLLLSLLFFRLSIML